MVASEIAERRHGVVTRGQLLDAGIGAAVVERAVREQHLHRLHRGVFALMPPSLLSDEGKWLAAVIACGDRAALSHGSSGQLSWIVPRNDRTGLHVAILGRNRHRVPGVIVHRPRRLDPADLTIRRGIPTTTCTRTVWDLAYTDSPGSTRRAFRQADKRGWLDRDRLAELLLRSQGRRGNDVIRRLLESGSVPLWRTRSRLEEIIVELCCDDLIDLPAVNVPLLDYEVDFLWERERFVVEADGGDHLDTEQRDADNERDVRLARAGYLVRRYSWWATQRPREVAAEIRAILAERRNLLPGPPTPLRPS